MTTTALVLLCLLCLAVLSQTKLINIRTGTIDTAEIQSFSFSQWKAERLKRLSHVAKNTKLALQDRQFLSDNMLTNEPLLLLQLAPHQPNSLDIIDQHCGSPHQVIDEDVVVARCTQTAVTALQTRGVIAWHSRVPATAKSFLTSTAAAAAATLPFDASVNTDTSVNIHCPHPLDLRAALHHTPNNPFALQSWSAYFRDTVHADMRHAGPSAAAVRVCFSGVRHVVNTLTELEHVEWVEVLLPRRLLNHYGVRLLQSASAGTAGSPSASTAEVWEAGVRGAGQVVAIGDTGVDWDHCFFNDPEHSVPVNTVDTAHRKIISYRTIETSDGTSDAKDEYQGHGTHVSGTAIGSPALPSISSNSNSNSNDTNDRDRWSGAAPDAKLYFTDMMQTGDSVLLVPEDIRGEYLLPPLEQAGSRISSSSWGCSLEGLLECRFDCDCTWGSLASQYGQERGSVAEDSQCQALFGQRCCHVCNVYDTQTRDVDSFLHEHQDTVAIFAAGNDGRIAMHRTVGAPATGKNLIAVGASRTSQAGFRAEADLTDFVGNLQQVPPNSEEECCAYTDTEDPDTQHRVRRLCCPSYARSLYDDAQEYSADNLAAFSAAGPAYDGRIKPDVVAVGERLFSALSDEDTSSFQCNLRYINKGDSALTALEGTSMAAPLVAGGAALVREYFEAGHHRRSGAFSPTGPLVKAMLLHAAAPLSGRVELGNGTHVSADTAEFRERQGFGVVSVGDVLRFGEAADTLYVSNDTAVSLLTYHRHCFESTSATRVSATLVWYDRPPSMLSSRALVNDLDVEIRVDGEAHNVKDRLNTVERVSDVEVASAGVEVHVIVDPVVVASSQTYALVVTGDLEPCGVSSHSRLSRLQPGEALLVGGLSFMLVMCCGVCCVSVGVGTRQRKHLKQQQQQQQ